MASASQFSDIDRGDHEKSSSKQLNESSEQINAEQQTNQRQQADIAIVSALQSPDLPESESASKGKPVKSEDKQSTSSPSMVKESDSEGSNEIITFDVIGSDWETTTLIQLRERLESSDNAVPKFPPDQTDRSVLHTVQSWGLHELLESESGECHSSSAARELASCLPDLKKLESLVLVGTILRSDDICNFATHLKELKHLKKIDLRLNKQFDDRAFAAITNSLWACKTLIDLRLSLYRVTQVGFDHVENEMNKSSGKSWGNLTTLHLLHGTPVETFVKFLADNMKCFRGVKYFHISGIFESGKLSETLVDHFHSNMCNPKIMPNIKELVIGNHMESLKTRFPSKKPQEKGGKEDKNLTDRAEPTTAELTLKQMCQVTQQALVDMPQLSLKDICNGPPDTN